MGNAMRTFYNALTPRLASYIKCISTLRFPRLSAMLSLIKVMTGVLVIEELTDQKE